MIEKTMTIKNNGMKSKKDAVGYSTVLTPQTDYTPYISHRDSADPKQET